MKQLSLLSLKRQLKKYHTALFGKPVVAGPFEQRIKQRHTAFWSPPNAEQVRNTPMAASDPLEKWRDVENWQRKLSNKHNAREFAKMHGCRVAELYWKGRDHRQISFETLPPQFVIRPTIGHSSGLVFLMDNKLNLMDKKTYTTDSLQAILGKALAQNPHLEFLVEEFLRDETGKYRIPDDYKMYMFNGALACFQVINRVGPKKGYDSCYDEHWNRIPNISWKYPQAALQQAPACLQEMIGQGRQLSKTYGIFVRVDFYATDKGPVFGEFTPTPGVGKTFTPEAEQMLMEYWEKYCPGMI